MPPAQKPPLRIEGPTSTSANAATIIFLHGYGDDADGWKNVAEQFHAAQKLPYLTWLFPNAPWSMESGTTAWFEPTSFSSLPVGRSTNPSSNADLDDEDDDLDQEGILKSVEYVARLIDEEVAKGVSPERIVIGGFSQGSMVSLCTALGGKWQGKLAGVVALSGALPGGKLLSAERKSEEGLKTKFFLGHGTKDFLVPMRIFRETKERLTKLVGMERLQIEEYEGMGHVTSGKELMDVCTFLESILPGQ
jgi:predicted esterase